MRALLYNYVWPGLIEFLIAAHLIHIWPRTCMYVAIATLFCLAELSDNACICAQIITTVSGKFFQEKSNIYMWQLGCLIATVNVVRNKLPRAKLNCLAVHGMMALTDTLCVINYTIIIAIKLMYFTVLQQKEEEEIADRQEEQEIADRQEEEEIADRQEEEEIADRQEEEEIADRQEEEEIADRQEEEEIADRQEEQEIADRQEEEEIADRQEEQEIADRQEEEESHKTLADVF